MDNLSFGPALIKSLHKHLKEEHDNKGLVFDCHLMVTDPVKWAKRLAPYAHSITIHYEALLSSNLSPKETILELKRVLGRDSPCKLGLAIKPSTLVSEINPLIPLIDLVLVMTVEPGHGGQALLPHCLQKIAQLNELRAVKNMAFLIQVDGGVNEDTISQIREAGDADVLVAGSAIFDNVSPGDAYKRLATRLRERRSVERRASLPCL